MIKYLNAVTNELEKCVEQLRRDKSIDVNGDVSNVSNRVYRTNRRNQIESDRIELVNRIALLNNSFYTNHYKIIIGRCNINKPQVKTN